MVKNELSISASETKRVAENIANTNKNKIHTQISKKIFAINEKINFLSKQNDNKIFEESKKNLKNELLKLNSKNPYDAYCMLYTNLRNESMLKWSFVNLDREAPDQEKTKAKIGHHRYELVHIDNKIELAKFNQKWYEVELNNTLSNKEEYELLKENLFNDHQDKAKLNKESYANFILKVNKEYKSYNDKFFKDFDNLFDKLENCLNKAYENTASHDLKDKAIDLFKNIKSLYATYQENYNNLQDKIVDQSILKQQEKEKLDVKEEKSEINNSINSLSASIKDLNNQIEELKKSLDLLLKQIDSKIDYTYEFDANIDKSLNELFDEITNLYVNKDRNLSENIFELVKNYIYSINPLYKSFYDSKYKEYEEENKKYQIENSIDVKDEKSYLEKISLKNSNTIKEETNALNAKYKELEDSLEKQFKEKIAQIKKAKQDRIEEYKKQKANAKIALKMADAQKASDLKEIVSLYKKEINTGEVNRYKEAFVNKMKAKAQLKSNYNVELSKITKPDALSFNYESNVKTKALNKEKAKEKAKLNKFIKKELSSSRYHKNMTIEKKESYLGYFFLAVWAVGFVVFTIVPILYSIGLIFSDINRYTVTEGYPDVISIKNLFNGGKLFPNWTGWDNFETIFLSDVTFAYTYVPRFFRNLLLFTPIIVFISFVLALLLNTKIKGRTIFRIIYFLPVVIVSGPVLKMLNDTDQNKESSIKLSLDGSSIATILETLSPKVLQYANEVFQNFIIILWMTGVPVVLFISALQKINKQLYEAADIDGANGWQKLWTITFPLIKSILLIVCLFTIMQVTTINYSGINPINDWISNQISSKHFSWAALGSWIQTLIVLLFVLLAFLLFREKEFVSKQKSFEEMEAYKAKKQARKAKLYETLHIGDIKNFFTKLFAPLSKTINVLKEKNKIKK